MNDIPASKDSWQQNHQLTKNKSGRFFIHVLALPARYWIPARRTIKNRMMTANFDE